MLISRIVKRLILSNDSIGILASSLCLVHCLATPLIFIAKACSSFCCSEAPLWWQLIDYAFLVVCFFAIYSVSSQLNKIWLKTAFWASWLALLLVLLNHSFGMMSLNTWLFHLPSFMLITLHFYNMAKCRCQKNCSA